MTDHPPPTEADIQADIVNALIRTNVGVMRVNTVKARTEAGAVVKSYTFYPVKDMDTGCSDLIAFADGIAAFMEVKTPRGKQSDSQKRFEGWCRYYNMPYYIVRSADEALNAWSETVKKARATWLL